MTTRIRVAPQGALVFLGFNGPPGTVSLELTPAEAQALAAKLEEAAWQVEQAALKELEKNL